MEILKLKEVMKQKGITGVELSSTVGVTPASISNIVNGNSFPKPETLLDIAKALDVDVRELFLPTKDATPLNGFVEFNGEIRRIRTVKELNNLINEIEAT